jgi:hypothetical protein
MVIRGNKSSKRPRVTLKKRRQWCVREKLMVLHFLDRSNSVRATDISKVEPSLIRKSFKCCGISVKTDGTEDDENFDYDNLMIDEDKEKSYMDSELAEEDGEEDGQDYNNWNEI